MKHFKKFVFGFVITVALLISINPVSAETRTDGDLEMSGDFPVLSSSDGDWYPGRNLSKIYQIKNKGDRTQSFGVRLINLTNTGGIADSMNVAISRDSDDLYGQRDGDSARSTKNISDFYNDTAGNSIRLFNLNTGDSTSILFTFTMDKNLISLESQDKSLIFDLDFGFDPESTAPTAAPTGEPGPTETPTPPTGGTGDATSRFTITNLINRSRTVVTVAPPVLGIEEARIPREWPRQEQSPWLSSLFRGVSCRVNSLAITMLFIQPLLSLLILKYSQRQYLNWSVFSLLGVALISDQLNVYFTCFSFLSLLWLNLFWLVASFYLLRLRLRNIPSAA